MQVTQTHKFSDDGDLTIYVGPEHERQAFIVDTAIIRNASTVWKQILISEANKLPNSKASLLFSDDDPEAFKIVMQTAYYQLEEIPTNPEKGLMVRTMFLCDK